MTKIIYLFLFALLMAACKKEGGLAVSDKSPGQKIEGLRSDGGGDGGDDEDDHDTSTPIDESAGGPGTTTVNIGENEGEGIVYNENFFKVSFSYEKDASTGAYKSTAFSVTKDPGGMQFSIQVTSSTINENYSGITYSFTIKKTSFNPSTGEYDIVSYQTPFLEIKPLQGTYFKSW